MAPEVSPLCAGAAVPFTLLQSGALPTSLWTEHCADLSATFHVEIITTLTHTRWLRCCATNRKVAGSIPADVNGIFHWHIILPIALWPWGRLNLLQKWVLGTFPGGKGGRCLRLTILPPSCAVVTKSGNLNFLEPSGPVQACNGTALLYISTMLHTVVSREAALFICSTVIVSNLFEIVPFSNAVHIRKYEPVNQHTCFRYRQLQNRLYSRSRKLIIQYIILDNNKHLDQCSHRN
jgi:hypothetical protein